MFPELFTDEVFRLETARLWLRWPRIEDAPAIERFVRRPEVATMTSSWPHPLPAGLVAARLERARQGNGDGSTMILAITPKREPKRPIGLIGSSTRQDGEAPNLGFLLTPEQWGKGLMTEALDALLDVMFRSTAIDTVRAGAFPVNTPARRVLEKCGFVHVGRTADDIPTRGGLVAIDRFALSREVWRCRTRLTQTATGQQQGAASMSSQMQA